MANQLKREFPDCFPENFESEILPKNLKDQQLHVFRVCLHGPISRETFCGTYEEAMKAPNERIRNIRLRGKPLNDAGTYSTSCFRERVDCEGSLVCLQRHHPSPFLIEGTASSEYGPLQETKERKKCNTSHVDWWLYKNADPSEKFHKVKDVEECEREA